MRWTVTIAGLALAVGLAPGAGHAACQKRTTGTVVGAVAGGLLGNAVAGRGSRTEGTLLGAAAGGLVGNQVSKCRYSRHYSYRRSAPRAAYSPPRAGSPYYAQASCRYENRAFYDASGRMVYAPTRVCR